MRKVKGFTLIELLVVISIVVLLMAILLPALQRVRRQAKAVACQSNLRQWGVIFSTYTNDNRGALPRHSSIGPLVWPKTLRSYYPDSNDLLLCPMATRSKIRPDNPYTIQDWHLRVVGSKSTAWEYRFTVGQVRVHFSGSYGVNKSLHSYYHSIDSLYPHSVRNSIPVLLDCVYMHARPYEFEDPPEYEGHIERYEGMTYFCINRHNGGINSLFLDWSARKVGLKELWTLQWGPFSRAVAIANSPWTKAGGVQPEDWPQWMRHFKDY